MQWQSPRCEVLASRLNVYRDGKDWKPFHHDSHAFSKGQQEDFTAGASFGAPRALAFQHVRAHPAWREAACSQLGNCAVCLSSGARHRMLVMTPARVVQMACNASKRIDAYKDAVWT